MKPEWCSHLPGRREHSGPGASKYKKLVIRRYFPLWRFPPCSQWNRLALELDDTRDERTKESYKMALSQRNMNYLAELSPFHLTAPLPQLSGDCPWAWCSTIHTDLLKTCCLRLSFSLGLFHNTNTSLIMSALHINYYEYWNITWSHHSVWSSQVLKSNDARP